MDHADLRRQYDELLAENTRLKKLLELTDREAAPAKPDQTAVFDARPGPVDMGSDPRTKVAFYLQMFSARQDVYATRWENTRTGRSGWVPAVAGGWRRHSRHHNVEYLPLTPDVLAAHLRGDRRIGLYPLLSDGTCHWIAADFDGAAATLDALAYLKAARAEGIAASLEVSSSGLGAHVWIFFTSAVSAGTARAMATGFLREASTIRGDFDLRSYDRLFPSQDMAPSGGIGNLIAAPLHGGRRQDGATVFLDLARLEPRTTSGRTCRASIARRHVRSRGSLDVSAVRGSAPPSRVSTTHTPRRYGLGHPRPYIWIWASGSPYVATI